MRQVYFQAAVLLLVGLCSSCSLTGKPDSQSIFEDPRFEVVSPIDQAKEEIAKMPQDFVIPSSDDLYAWERTETFFKSYTKNPNRVRQGSVGTRSAITNRGVFGERYQFAVTKEEVAQGYRYKVNCFLPPNTAGDCDLNAKNVARFIRDGYIETTLLNQ